MAMHTPESSARFAADDAQVGKCIGAGLDRMTAVAPDPSPANCSLRAEKDQLAPQFLVLQIKATAVAPAKPLPTKDQEPHSIYQQFRVRA